MDVDCSTDSTPLSFRDPDDKPRNPRNHGKPLRTTGHSGGHDLPRTVRPRPASGLARLELAHHDGQELYERISVMDRVTHDPCVLDTFEAAIHFARTGEAVPWWDFSRKRKANQS